MFFARPTRLHAVYFYGGVGTALQPWQELFECFDQDSPIAAQKVTDKNTLRWYNLPRRAKYLEYRPISACPSFRWMDTVGIVSFESTHNKAVAD